MNDPDFWNNQDNAKKVTKELSNLKNKSEQLTELENFIDDIDTYSLLIDEEFEKDLADEIVEYINDTQKVIDKYEVEFLLNGKFDHNNAILSIHPGAGGTESQDWAEMLLRMYTKWCDSNGYKYDIVEYVNGDEAGVKSVSVEITGDYAFGFLKSEIGVHRLVRISPFNAQGKRQTSFASVFVYAQIEDDIEVEINQKDLKIDTYRASGAGGQHVNTTDSAVRITHLPTNIVVSCQNQRSQTQNKEKAMQILKSRIYEQLEEERRKERQETEDSKSDISWGSQIRSYVFHPYQMVKDHRTNYDIGNTERVMNGDLNEFINSYLKWKAEK